MKKLNLDSRVADLNFGKSNTRVQNALRNRVRNILELVNYSKRDLIRFQNMGMSSIMDIEKVLDHYGLRLGMSGDEIMEYMGVGNAEPIIPKDPDFGGLRYDVAKCVLFAFASHSKDLTDQDISSAIEVADVFLRKISETKTNESNQNQDEQSFEQSR